MYSLPTPAFLHITRAYGTRLFHRFGIHCATHQIRLILVCSIVISSLLFPAIAIYAAPETHFFNGFTFRVLDPFSTPDDVSSYFSQQDIRQLWEGHSTLRVRDDSVARAQCGTQSILRLERVLVGTVSQKYGLDPLDRSILLTTHRLQRRISDIIADQKLPCIKMSDGSCFSLSPLAFWNDDLDILAADDNILDTLNLSPNVTASGITVTLDMVLAGRELPDPTSSNIDAAMFLVLTYLFPDRDCLGNQGHFQWLRVLEEAVAYSGDLMVQAQTPKLIALEYDRNTSATSRFTVLSVFCVAAYLAFFVYCFRSMKRLGTVHSHFGLAVTGVIELVVSTVASLSVCALAGFRITMVPWELFPIIVIFIGVENMFHIVDAVLKTPVTVPVKDRIAQGLSQAGTSNTLKLVSYNAVLGVIAGCSTGAIRQFCAFSIVVLVAHWFLVHTFFVTVLSIDIQRLELDELLRQNTNLAPTDKYDRSENKTLPPARTWGQALAAVRNTVRGRPAKNISLLVLLGIAAILYYATSPTSAPVIKEDIRLPFPRHSLRQANQVSDIDKVSPAFRIWQTLNPADDSLVHIRLESPTILMLAPEAQKADDQTFAVNSERSQRGRAARTSRLSRTMRPVWWLMKIVVAPMATTTALLYGLLLYLLKNVELLEAQRQKPEHGPTSSDERSVDADISFRTLPRAFPTDVDMIAASKDGSIIAMLGLQNEVVLCRTATQMHITLDTSAILLGGSASTPLVSTVLTSIAVNEFGTMCAIGTGSGIVGVWSISKDQVRPLTRLSLGRAASSAVIDLQFTTPAARSPSPARPLTPSPPSSEDAFEELPCLYATYENGAAVKWDIDSVPKARYVVPTRSASVIKSMLLPVHGDDRLLVGFALEDGSLELCDLDGCDEVLPRECWLSAGNPLDLVSKVDICKLVLDGHPHIIVGAATHAGVVSLWDAGKRECLYIMDEPFGMINHLRLTTVRWVNCSMCGELPCENFLITFSVGQAVLFYRGYVYLPTRRCACPRNNPQPTLRTSLLGRRSRSGSTTSLTSSNGTTTPVHSHSRARVPSFSSDSMFPVSGHGVHSRRASDKEGVRRTYDAFFINADGEDAEPRPVGPQDITPSAGSFMSSNGPVSIWQSLIVVRVADAKIERGSWDVAGEKVVGVRRRPRPTYSRGSQDVVSRLKAGTHGLSTSTLDRWELWTFDPLTSRLQASSLTALNEDAPEREGHWPERRREHPLSTSTSMSSRINSSLLFARKTERLIPRLHFTRVAPFVSSPTFCLAGFGNTVGLFDLTIASSSRRRRKRSSADVPKGRTKRD